MTELDALKKLSAHVGSDPLLVQAAGGNTSLKQDGVMWIKASGIWLRDAEAEDVFVPVDLPALLTALAKNEPSCETCIDFIRTDLNTMGLRPSIETTVHALMPQRVVVHVHCVNTIAWAIRAAAEALLGEKLKAFRWAFIPYARPGLLLADAIVQRLRPGVDVLVLGNHGLVVAAESVSDAECLLDRVVAVLRLPARSIATPDYAALVRACKHTDYTPAVSDETHALATDGFALPRAKDISLYPDHVVFLGVGIATEIANNTPLVALSGKGVLIRKDAKPAVEAMARCLADVMRRIGPQDSLVALSTQDIDDLINWDAEKYRQNFQANIVNMVEPLQK